MRPATERPRSHRARRYGIRPASPACVVLGHRPGVTPAADRALDARAAAYATDLPTSHLLSASSRGRAPERGQLAFDVGDLRGQDAPELREGRRQLDDSRPSLEQHLAGDLRDCRRDAWSRRRGGRRRCRGRSGRRRAPERGQLAIDVGDLRCQDAPKLREGRGQLDDSRPSLEQRLAGDLRDCRRDAWSRRRGGRGRCRRRGGRRRCRGRSGRRRAPERGQLAIDVGDLRGQDAPKLREGRRQLDDSGPSSQAAPGRRSGRLQEGCLESSWWWWSPGSMSSGTASSSMCSRTSSRLSSSR